MRLSEAAVFKWVVIVGVAGLSVILVTAVTRPLVGALWGLALVIAGCVYGYRWARSRGRQIGTRD